MVFQNYALYPHMTVFENMAYGLKIRGLPKAEIRARVAGSRRAASIGQLLDRKPRQLSGGQRQRVAMGRAIVRHPKLFLFDEPLSNLDAKLRVQMRPRSAGCRSALAVTSLFVTHDQVEAMTLGDRLVVMNAGRRADRHADGGLVEAGRHLCRQLHRQPGDELPARHAGERRPRARLAGGARLALHRWRAAGRRGDGRHHRHPARTPAAGSADGLLGSPSTWPNRWARRRWCTAASAMPGNW